MRATVGALGCEDVVEKVAALTPPVRLRRLQDPFGRGRDEGIGVDLPVRVGLGDPDLLAPVLKTEHLLHVAAPGKLTGAVDEGVQDEVDAVGPQLVEGGVVVGRVTNHLTAARPGALGQQGGPEAGPGYPRPQPLRARPHQRW